MAKFFIKNAANHGCINVYLSSHGLNMLKSRWGINVFCLCARSLYLGQPHFAQRPPQAEVRQTALWKGSEQRALPSHTNYALVAWLASATLRLCGLPEILAKNVAVWRTGNGPDRDGGAALAALT